MKILLRQFITEGTFNTPEYNSDELINLIGRINSFRPFINCSEEQDRTNRVKRDMIDIIVSSKNAVDSQRTEWYGNYNDPNNPYLLNESSGPSQKWKEQNSKKIVSPLSNIHIHGESHFNNDEVNRIRQTIIQSKPDIIIHELNDDMDFYKKHLPGTKLYQLERGLDQKIYKYFPNDYASQFKHREDNMIRNIENIRQFHPEANIHVVVGDTHLRTIPTKELGNSSPFHNYDYKIYRSKTPEIK